MGFGEKMLNSLERRFGNLAMPGLLKWIAGFQLLGLLLSLISPGFIDIARFDQAAIYKGEVWRLFSWLFAMSSAGTLSILMIFFIIFMFMVSDAMEQSMGAFRKSFFIFTTAVCLVIAGLIPGVNGFGSFMLPVFLSVMVMTAATIIPEHIIYLWLIIPIKMKWVGWLSAISIILMVMTTSNKLLYAGLTTFGLLPFLVGIVPPLINNFKNDARASARRAKFQRDSGANEDSAFHTCYNCGITDQRDPHMEFRVSSEDGNEYCVSCLKRKAAEK